jgi:tRNA wybutosine-synthesizing protein 1
MINENSKKSLEKQHYGIVGNHSAVKICGWTKNLITNKGGCYKYKFYGIKSHKCLQMTTSLMCANRCIYCWRDYKAPISKEWKSCIDEPNFIIENSIKAQKKLLSGFGGNDKTNMKLFKESDKIEHVALSLTGEPITYPKINEIIDSFHDKKISTFLVTNAQYPDKIKNLKIVTQLYISLDAPNKELSKMIGKPLFSDYWERLLQSLDEMKKKNFRTTIRMTMIKGMNMDIKYINDFKNLILRSDADFIEVKGYMFVGSSRQRLKKENMPYHEEIVDYCKEFIKILPDYEIVNEQKPSRVVLIAKKKFKERTWIDFDKFFDIIKKKEYFNIKSEEYSTKTKMIDEPKIDEIELQD